MNPTEARPRWTMLGLLFAARVGLGLQFQTMGSVGDLVADHLRLNAAEIGSLIGLFLSSGIALALPAGAAARYASDRVLVFLGLLTLALGGCLAACAHGFAVLAVARLLCGAGFVIANIYFTKMVVDWFARRELATALAILVMSWPFGIAMGQVGHGWLASIQGWRTVFVAAALYCLVAAFAVLVGYRPPPRTATTAVGTARTSLTGREWSLTLIAAFTWAAFNAAYVVYLSFAPRVLVAGGLGSFEAASTVSLASWVMIFSGAFCGQLADRTRRPNPILYACLGVAMVSLVLLPNVGWAVPLTLAFGLIGMAPAGIVMAMSAEAMAPHKRAFGMSAFFTVYFLLTAPAPALAGWLYDRTGDVFMPILLAIALFALTAAGAVAFRLAQRARF